jgi:hypothetical protein
VPTDPEPDPVLARRARYRGLADRGQRLGYLLYAAAMVVFVVGFFLGFGGPVVAVIIGAMAVGSVVLLPAIIVGYAVKAAERDDREQGRR